MTNNSYDVDLTHVEYDSCLENEKVSDVYNALVNNEFNSDWIMNWIRV